MAVKKHENGCGTKTRDDDLLLIMAIRHHLDLFGRLNQLAPGERYRLRHQSHREIVIEKEIEKAIVRARNEKDTRIPQNDVLL